MCVKVILSALVRVELTVLGSETDTMVDIMVFFVLVFVSKRVGFRIFTISV